MDFANYLNKLTAKEMQHNYIAFDRNYTYQFTAQTVNISIENLKRLGLNPGDSIMVTAEQKYETIILMLACLFGGFVYAPIDPGLKKDRFDKCVESFKPDIIINAKHKTNKFPSAEFSDICNSMDMPCLQAGFNQYPRTLDEAAIVIHTSGTTGEPKAVTLTCGSLLSFLESFNEVLKPTTNSRFLSTSPLFFDAALFGALMPILCGTTVVLNAGLLIPDIIFTLIEVHGITHLTAIGTALNILGDKCDLFAGKCLTMKHIATGAEVIPSNTINKWISVLPEITISHWYGPTECTIASTVFLINQNNIDRSAARYPIGKPIKNVYCYILDGDKLRDIQPGVQGELCISGNQLMSGYWKAGEIDDSCLIYQDHVTYYKTGDYCSVGSTGDIFFHDRVDNQIKKNGYRIELSEIEINANKLFQDYNPRVISTVEDGVTKIVLFFERGSSSIEYTELEVKERLSRCLADYMVPDIIRFVDKYPQTASGKISKSALTEMISIGKG